MFVRGDSESEPGGACCVCARKDSPRAAAGTKTRDAAHRGGGYYPSNEANALPGTEGRSEEALREPDIVRFLFRKKLMEGVDQ